MEVEELKEKLEQKLNQELQIFKEKLRNSDPDIIMDKAYELVSKEEIVYIITEKNYTKSELMGLLKTNGILNHCYDEWLKSDENYSEALDYSVNRRINSILDNIKKKEIQKNRDAR